MRNPYLWLVVALLLIYLEFFLPGGIFAVVGGLFLVASVVLFAVEASSPLTFFLYVLAVAALLFGLFKLALWRIVKSKPEQSFYSDDSQEGFRSNSFNAALIGQYGEASCDLRPAGHIKIGAIHYQAISEGGFIEKGAKVLVTGGEGSSLIVTNRY